MPTDLSPTSTEQFDATVNGPAGGDPRTSASVRTPLQNVVNRARFIWQRLQEVIGFFLPLGPPASLYPIALTVNGSSGSPPYSFFVTGHGLNANDPVQFWAIGGNLPAPLAGFTTYYVVGGTMTPNAFQVSLTSGGSAVTLSNLGSGAIYGAKLGASALAQQIAGLALSLAGYAPLAATLNAFTGNMTIAGTLGVTGLTSVGSVSAGTVGVSSLTSSGTISAASTASAATVAAGAYDLQNGGSQTRAVRTSPNWANSTSFLPAPVGPGSPLSGGVYWLNQSTGAVICFPLDMPNGVKLTSVVQNIKPFTGHSAFPGGAPTMPTMLVVKSDNLGNGTQLGSTTTDTSSTAGAYETAHDLTVGGLTEIVDLSAYSYYVILYTESGANFIANTVVARPRMTWIGQGNSML